MRFLFIACTLTVGCFSSLLAYSESGITEMGKGPWFYADVLDNANIEFGTTRYMLNVAQLEAANGNP